MDALFGAVEGDQPVAPKRFGIGLEAAPFLFIQQHAADVERVRRAP